MIIENNNVNDEKTDKFINKEIDTYDIKHKEGFANKDHYHEKHHFTVDGKHDDITDDEFVLRNSFMIRSKGEWIYKISISGVILALALIATALDGYGLEVPLSGLFGGVLVPIRIFDISVILIGLAVTGPLFGGVIGFILPWIHFLMHSHSIFTPLIESFSYTIMIIFFWFIYYGVFRNSPFHKNPNHKIDLFKRWMPMPIIIIFGVALFTSVTILILYINQLTAGGHAAEHVSTFSADHDHSESLGDFLENSKWNIIILIGLQVIRFVVCYTLFAIVEPKAKKLNHRYGIYNY